MSKNERLLVTICAVIILASLVRECTAQMLTLVNQGYTVQFNVHTTTAQQVEWCIYPTDLGAYPRASVGSFKVDKRTPKPRAQSKHYTNSGYQRGHLCPSADRSGDIDRMKETYLLSNVVPMAPKLNMGQWKQTEITCRALAYLYNGVRVRVHVWTDSVFISYLRQSPIAIPKAFGKQVFTISTDSLLCEWYLENR